MQSLWSHNGRLGFHTFDGAQGTHLKPPKTIKHSSASWRRGLTWCGSTRWCGGWWGDGGDQQAGAALGPRFMHLLHRNHAIPSWRPSRTRDPCSFAGTLGGSSARRRGHPADGSVAMSHRFFDDQILNSPYEHPADTGSWWSGSRRRRLWKREVRSSSRSWILKPRELQICAYALYYLSKDKPSIHKEHVSIHHFAKPSSACITAESCLAFIWNSSLLLAPRICR